MPIRTRRWNDPIELDDGERILITRYRPRGLPKSEETWSLWLKDLAPSEELLQAFHGKGRPPITWDVYRAIYLREMRNQKELIAQLAKEAKDKTLTLLCSSSCTRENRCHRSLLKQLIEREMTS